MNHLPRTLALATLCTAAWITPNAQATSIDFTETDISGSSWEYTYSVQNDTLVNPIQEFTIYFALGDYSNLTLGSSPGNWSPIAINPDPSLPADGFYDALALDTGLAPGDSEGGFSVMFTWLGSGTPGSQSFQVVDPNTFNVLDSGNTIVASSSSSSSSSSGGGGSTSVPEPGSGWLWSCGLIAMLLFRSTARVAASHREGA